MCITLATLRRMREPSTAPRHRWPRQPAARPLVQPAHEVCRRQAAAHATAAQLPEPTGATNASRASAQTRYWTRDSLERARALPIAPRAPRVLGPRRSPPHRTRSPAAALVGRL